MPVRTKEAELQKLQKQLDKYIKSGMIDEAIDHADVYLARVLTADEMRQLAKAHIAKAHNSRSVERLLSIAETEQESPAFGNELQSIEHNFRAMQRLLTIAAEQESLAFGNELQSIFRSKF